MGEPAALPAGPDAILENARAAVADFRAQIDLQVRAAESIETRATAVLTVGAGGVAIVAGRLRVHDVGETIIALVFGGAALALIVTCLMVLASRSSFAYGVDANDLVPLLGQLRSREEITVTMAEALRQGRNANEVSIERKFRPFVFATISLVALALSGAALFAAGAIK